MQLNERELGTVLAALRFWQRKGPGESEGDIATNGGDIIPLSASEIDLLCERINTGDVRPPRPAVKSSDLKNISDVDLTHLLHIHIHLSPENLAGDGEYPHAVVVSRKASLDAELIALASRLHLPLGDVDEDSVFRENDRRIEARRGSTSSRPFKR